MSGGEVSASGLRVRSNDADGLALVAPDSRRWHGSRSRVLFFNYCKASHISAVVLALKSESIAALEASHEEYAAVRADSVSPYEMPDRGATTCL